MLVVEDEAMIAMMTEDFLESLGCRIAGTALFLEDAVEKARTLALDVALIDVNLGGKLSYPVAEALQARKIPFVFATGYATTGLPTGLHDAPVLSKPFQWAKLEAALRTVMDGR